MQISELILIDYSDSTVDGCFFTSGTDYYRRTKEAIKGSRVVFFLSMNNYLQMEASLIQAGNEKLSQHMKTHNYLSTIKTMFGAIWFQNATSILSWFLCRKYTLLITQNLISAFYL